MAFRIDTSFQGIPVVKAYARIEDFNGTKESMNIQLVFYVNEQACSTGESFKRDSYSFVPDVSDDALNYHKQGYEHLKILPEFIEAVDA
ncbi:hypothetical protein BK133_00780 [Paenibacillus sp. FSL H8-0548]|uniref:hypothetical protein n=1 Tax=Paenibacillus sp. FSL H8-0548 TaxID=1920422 RepID=UPI00096E11F1|nr:hypothetical protein [Paenibacillus sp. FSL H8-0548]OMF38771.1 hypothetical protein BK133_00780 [Paenibacillus sp. FSL H8-0548]